LHQVLPIEGFFMMSFEVNFDGLVGPTHNYSGLSYGNVASAKHRSLVSHPKKAALQGLKKMKLLLDLGFTQAVLPPQERPHLPSLKQLGFSGTDEEILKTVQKKYPVLLSTVSSSASMWTANAATTAPSVDTSDGLLHITPANLYNKWHRSIESLQTTRILKKIFSDPRYFVVHEPLPCREELGDEGAANHTRLCVDHAQKGLHIFVYGRAMFDEKKPKPKNFPARQTLEACEAIIRLHRLPQEQTLCVQQNPDMIDSGVFHNDVISVGHLDTFFVYDSAFVNTHEELQKISEQFYKITKKPLETIIVPAKDISVHDVVTSYLFNTQLLAKNGHKMLIAPKECQDNPTIKSYLDTLVGNKKHSIQEVIYLDLRESMQNGGGPACLRQRIVLNENERKACHPDVFLTERLYEQLVTWVEKYYFDDLTPNDLADPQLFKNSRAALSELTGILNLGSIYEFQM